MPKPLSIKEFAELHKVTPRLVKGWIRRGLPRKKGKLPSGQIGNLISLKPAAEWLALHGIVTKYMGEGALGNLRGGKKREPARKSKTKTKAEKGLDAAAAKKEIDEILLHGFGLESTRERLRWLESRIFSALWDLTDGKGDAAQIVALESALTKLMPLLKDIELGYLKYQQQVHELIPVAEVKRTWLRLAVGTKQAVMTIGNNTAPLLKRYLKKADDLNAVTDIIDQGCREALLSLDVDVILSDEGDGK